MSCMLILNKEIKNVISFNYTTIVTIDLNTRKTLYFQLFR